MLGMAERFSGEWRSVKLSEIGYTYGGLSGKTKADFEHGTEKFITFLNVLNNTVINIRELATVNVRKDERQNKVKVGDIFFNASSETPEEVGMCAALLDDPGVCYLNSFCFGLRITRRDISPLFLSYYFNSKVGRDFMRIFAQGSTRYNMSKTKFMQQSITIPPLDEQIAIAETLSAFDLHLANLSELITKHEGIRAGALEDLLSGRTRLPGFRGEWRTVKLGELGKVKMCRRVFHSQTQSYGQVPFFKIGTFNTEPDAYISRELFEEYKRLYPYPKKGNILLSAAGTIGRTFFFDGRDAYFQDSNIVWLDADPAKVDGRFLMYFYQTYPWQNLEGTAIRRLYNKMILDTPINLPPVDEQIAIAETLSTLDLNISNLKAEHAKISALRTAAINDLLTGTTRLERRH